jgi:hypothetical protein
MGSGRIKSCYSYRFLESEIKAVIDMGIFKGVYEIENKWKAELSELAKNYQNT